MRDGGFSFLQGQSAHSRKDSDLRSVIQSRENALREVEKLVQHAEGLERKYNDKVLKQSLMIQFNLFNFLFNFI